VTDPKEEKVPEKDLTVKKETLKDLTVQPEKEKDVVAGGTPSRPRTGTNFTCNPC
jgi:hypothetical protein